MAIFSVLQITFNAYPKHFCHSCSRRAVSPSNAVGGHRSHGRGRGGSAQTLLLWMFVQRHIRRWRQSHAQSCPMENLTVYIHCELTLHCDAVSYYALCSLTGAAVGSIIVLLVPVRCLGRCWCCVRFRKLSQPCSRGFIHSANPGTSPRSVFLHVDRS